MKISIIIPFYDEEESVSEVLGETRRTNPEAEIIAVNDGSKDGTLAMVTQHPDVRLISFEQNLGQSAALFAGLTLAQGKICVMMDGDGQNDPVDIPKLVSMLKHANVACGCRQKRQDVWLRRMASWIANLIRRAVLHDRIHDTGCTLKALRKSDVRHLLPFDGLHRYLPVLLNEAGLRIVEVPVSHRPRKHGNRKSATTLNQARKSIPMRCRPTTD
jgi:dolichol-phosphate mannosyltransferase